MVVRKAAVRGAEQNSTHRTFPQLSLSSWSLGVSFLMSEPQFAHLDNWSTGTYITALLRG